MATKSMRLSRDWRDRLWDGFYGSALYRLTLRAKPPLRLKRLPPPPWPGDPERGTAIAAGRLICAGQPIDAHRPDWRGTALSVPALAELHSFGWLDDLAEIGGTAAQERARALIANWLDTEQGWHGIASVPAVAGKRIASWLAHARFISRGQADTLGPRILASLVRQAQHLARIERHGDGGTERLIALRGLIYARLCGLGEERVGAAIKRLMRLLQRQILADGGVIERAPAAQLATAMALVDIRDMMQAAGVALPDGLAPTIELVTGVLRFFRHGDGGLALFNGGGEERATLIDTVLARAGIKGKAAESAPQIGIQRVAADRALIFMDAGVPPPQGYDRMAHAGTLSFELSWGRERVIVNCGAMPTSDPAWHFAQRSTAAHSTLVVDDTNSAEILDSGGFGRRPIDVTCLREDDDGDVWIVASHNGYRPLIDLTHQRRLYLSHDGEDLRGEDTLSGTHVGSFAVRFHLHPDIQISLIQNGAAALLRAPSGAAWRFLASGGKIELAETVYLGRRGEARRSEQIVVTGPVSNGATVKWALRRIAKS